MTRELQDMFARMLRLDPKSRRRFAGALIVAFTTSGVIGYADRPSEPVSSLVASSDEETLAGDEKGIEVILSCPADHPFEIEWKVGVFPDENGDGIVCGNGFDKDVVDNERIKEGTGKIAGGHGNFFDKGIKVLQDISFSFHGIAQGKGGEAKGQFEYHDQTGVGPDLTVHGEVVCMTVAKNTATFIGEVTRSNDGLLPVGTFVAWFAEDNGEGANDNPDQVTRVTPIRPEGKGGPTCRERIKFPGAIEIVSGNIQVH